MKKIIITNISIHFCKESYSFVSPKNTSDPLNCRYVCAGSGERIPGREMRNEKFTDGEFLARKIAGGGGKIGQFCHPNGNFWH